ncbi:MAG: methionyl-tRNA synthetase [Patescibacteria group bacterium]|jgi:methionyl-tRNA synthetase|nr:methionyl-tRNA synthetase [Patescibacteria group bacterium]
MKNHFYITTTLPYVNSEPHIGFAMEIIRADIIARVKNLQGNEVFFNTGTDEHGSKIYENAVSQSITPQEYVDRAVIKFKELGSLLGLATEVPGIKYNFIRTTDAEHLKSAQSFWQKCLDNGDIYKKNYKVKYCVGCELEKTDSELVDNKCPLHPNREVEIREEENYFFKFSKYQKTLLDLYESNPNFVVPDFRQNEIKKFVERGLEDFSISRLKSKMPWGVDVPNDPEHAMYVWFDALVNYVSAVGWPHKMDEFQKWWVETGGVVQYAGKDNLRQQSAMWQAMLASAGLNFSRQIVIDGFINAEGGVKMSKSLGNTVAPGEIVSEYGADALRYYMAREIMPFEDGVFTKERFKDAYNANLANGLGNLVSRIMKMAKDNIDRPVVVSDPEDFLKYLSFFDTYEINKATDYIWAEIGSMDLFIQNNQPFKLVKTDKTAGQKMISSLVVRLYSVARMLNPIMPETSSKIKELIIKNQTPETPLFIRKD